MNFIQVRDGISIRKDCIEVVERVDDFHCKVTVNGTIYNTNFPYNTMMKLIDRDDSMAEYKTPPGGIKLPGISPMGDGQYFAG